MGGALEQRIAKNANVNNTHKDYTVAHTLLKPFQRCCKEPRPFSYMLGPSRVRSGSQELGPPRTEWLGRPASHCGDVVACTTS